MITIEIRGHVAESPTWSCQGCGEPWPCAEMRIIPREDAHTYLSLMASILPSAIRDLRGRLDGPDPIAIVRRFVWWLPLSYDEARAIAKRMR
ncbi:hypothetical protein [Micromonospora sp. WMMD736]|uniref:hypothetical protein n=1 Tax=Micromonospora sp. WMMD736 TaxID=3404112 RepID=UPI003B9261F9